MSDPIKIFGQEVSPQTLGILGAGIGGLFGAAGGSGQTSGSQGYAGGIPEYTASRSLVPDAFDPTGRRPGEAGRRYFTDTTFTRGADNAIMGGAELEAMNQAALEQQQAYQAAGEELLGLRALQQQQQYEAQQAAAAAQRAQQAALAQAQQNYYDSGAAAQQAYIDSLTQPTTTPDTTTADTTTADTITADTGLTVDEGPAIGPEQTRYDITTIPADGDYSQADVDYVIDALKAGDTTVNQIADLFVDGNIGGALEVIMLLGDMTPDQLSSSVNIDPITVNGERVSTGDPTKDMMITLINSGQTNMAEAAYMYGVSIPEMETLYQGFLNSLEAVQTAAQGGMM